MRAPAILDNAFRPNRFELAYGHPAPGRIGGGGDLATPHPSGARAALEACLARALGRPPCVVSFSGGRDSSAILATAVHVARREGLPLPVPVTLRFPDVDEADENRWQDHVITSLGLPDWERIHLEEIDFVGPVATEVLRRHGLLWPPNTHFHRPILEKAAGGSLLTGIDGDGLFGGWRWGHPDAPLPLGKRLGETWGYWSRASFFALPGPLRRVAGRRRFGRPPWIHADAWPQVERYLLTKWELEPRRWDARVAWWMRGRHLACIQWSMSLIAGDHDVAVVHPFLDPTFLATIAAEGAERGIGDRTTAMRALFGDVLPIVLTDRPSKAFFDGAMWASYSRKFIADWNGTGLDDTLIDTAQLRHEWSKPMPTFRTATLLQAAWLGTDTGTP